MTSESGFSLVEVLIAIALISVALLALGTMTLTAYSNTDQGGKSTALLVLTQRRLEVARNSDFSALSSGTTTEVLTGTYAGYTRTTQIQVDTPVAGVTQVSVTTTMPGGRDVSLVSLISE